MEIKIKEVEVSDDLAFARGTYSMDFIIKANGAVIPYEGKYLTVFKKQSDGSWKIYRDSYSSNTPPAK
jgi:ketosteroid isomerase-like protein